MEISELEGTKSINETYHKRLQPVAWEIDPSKNVPLFFLRLGKLSFIDERLFSNPFPEQDAFIHR